MISSHLPPSETSGDARLVCNPHSHIVVKIILLVVVILMHCMKGYKGLIYDSGAVLII